MLDTTIAQCEQGTTKQMDRGNRAREEVSSPCIRCSAGWADTSDFRRPKVVKQNTRAYLRIDK